MVAEATADRGLEEPTGQGELEETRRRPGDAREGSRRETGSGLSPTTSQPNKKLDHPLHSTKQVKWLPLTRWLWISLATWRYPLNQTVIIAVSIGNIICIDLVMRIHVRACV
jgi:hypothetical protein